MSAPQTRPRPTSTGHGRKPVLPGDGAVQMAAPGDVGQGRPKRCDWPCDRLAVKEEGGYWHCAEHLLEHRALEGPKYRITPAQRSEVIRELHSQGRNDEQIARITGFHHATVKAARQRMGLPAVSRPRQLSPIKHGTEAGAQAHYRRGDAPCASCREAETVGRRVRRAS